jgi:hypothetical protein
MGPHSFQQFVYIYRADEKKILLEMKTTYGCRIAHTGLTTPMMEAVSTSETLVNFYQATRCTIPEHSHLLWRKTGEVNSESEWILI